MDEYDFGRKVCADIDQRLAQIADHVLTGLPTWELYRCALARREAYLDIQELIRSRLSPEERPEKSR
jgi:hypothetical protein